MNLSNLKKLSVVLLLSASVLPVMSVVRLDGVVQGSGGGGGGEGDAAAAAAGGYVTLLPGDWQGYGAGDLAWGYDELDQASPGKKMGGTGFRRISSGAATGRLTADFVFPKGATSWATANAVRFNFWTSTGASDLSKISRIRITGHDGVGDHVVIYDVTADVETVTADVPLEVVIDDSVMTATMYERGRVELFIELDGASGEEYVYTSGMILDLE